MEDFSDFHPLFGSGGERKFFKLQSTWPFVVWDQTHNITNPITEISNFFVREIRELYFLSQIVNCIFRKQKSNIRHLANTNLRGIASCSKKGTDVRWGSKSTARPPESADLFLRIWDIFNNLFWADKSSFWSTISV